MELLLGDGGWGMRGNLEKNKKRKKKKKEKKNPERDRGELLKNVCFLITSLRERERRKKGYGYEL